MARTWLRALGVMMFGFAAPAYADNVMEAIPTSWRLQNYAGDGVTVWYSGSICPTGQLTFSSTMTSEDKNRFFAMVMTAKVSNRVIGVYYETATGSCQMTSFYMPY